MKFLETKSFGEAIILIASLWRREGQFGYEETEHRIVNARSRHRMTNPTIERQNPEVATF